MRILHVSDLHLGRGLGELSREAEQRAVVAEIVGAAADRGVTLTVISGDVFDAFTPPAWAEDLFFELIDGLAAGGRRAVAVIAGNHDSGMRLAAADPLARRLGILLAGDVGDPLRGHDGGEGTLRVIPLAPQVARIEVPGAEAPIVIGLLPFLSESRVAREGDGGELVSNRDDSSRYADRLVRELAARAAHRDPRAVNVLALHQFVTGSAPSDSERRLRLGALADLDASAIPAGLDYVALGHLHRPQQIAGSPSLAAYAGSPIAYSFSEAGQQKRAVLVEVVPGRPAMLTDVPLLGGRPVEIWAVGSIAEAVAMAAAPRSPVPIVEIRADLGRPLSAADGDALFALPNATVLSVRDLHDPAPVARAEPGELPDMRVEQLFRELWVRRHEGEPDEETMSELGSALLEIGAASPAGADPPEAGGALPDGGRRRRVKLLRLRVRGLRSFTRETEIDLARLGEQGLFAISGPTGAGKSTILDGIFLALFGKSPRGEASECVSAGALELTVRLELSIDRGEAARELAVERRFRWSRKRDAASGAVGSELRGAGKHPPLRIEERTGDAWTPVDLGGRKTDEVLSEQIVKVSMSDFQQAVVLPQGQFDALLRARPAERRTLVASLFRTEHLGQPLIEVLRAREIAVRSEMDRLEEAEREVAVSEAEAIAATAEADEAATRARAGAEALAATERSAALLRLGRQRCAARDEAAAALAGVERALAARGSDRARVERGRRAAGAEAAVRAVADAEEGAEAALRGAAAEEGRDAAEASARVAAQALAEASEARAAELPGALERLGRARQALDRGRDLGALDAAEAARARELAAAEEARAAALEQVRVAAGELAAVEAEELAATEALDRARVGEDERAEAVAAAAEAELAAAEERLERVIAAELAAAEEKVAELGVAIGAAEDAARAAEVEAEGRRAELRRLSIDAQRAAIEVEQGEHGLGGARRRAAAAELAAALRPGDACPVCGAREHPGADHGAAAAAVSFAERALGAAQRIARAAQRALDDAAGQAAARDEEARAIEARLDALGAELAAAQEAAAQQAAGTLVPRAVAEARAAASRFEARAELALGALAPERREVVRSAARREPPSEAEARVAALNRRAREAEQLERALGAARDRRALARAARAARGEALERAERAGAVAEGLHAAAAAQARARREEIRALLADIEPRAPAGPRAAATPSRSAAAWVAELEARTAALGRREEDARASLEAARGEALRLALEAREASVRRAAALARRDAARAAAEAAIARAGFESLEALRAALLDPAALEALAAELARLDGERAELAAVLASRRRDVEVEVSEDEATLAEGARDEARLAAGASRERAAHAAARREEFARRRARALELRARIELLEPRARRLGQIKQVVASNQLSELAAERHLEAVTRGAAELLRSLSSDRYALVRTPDGAFAVADAAHGGLVRPPSTLSGGETFLVSLALALSLSERIQLAGRTRFDFFFLDEGFGSLDQGTLETALGALERLRGPNRVIGMISHVPAIEERMPRRLRVFTERKGGATVVAHEP